jgi:hypothetical protein
MDDVLAARSQGCSKGGTRRVRIAGRVDIDHKT